MTERQRSLKERLSRLEVELDQLILLQESIKCQPEENVSLTSVIDRRQNIQLRKCQAVNLAVCNPAMINNRRPCCFHDPAPLSDISKFLQHINVNINKGAQAIAKLATSTSQEKDCISDNNKFSKENSLQKRENPSEFPNVWKSPTRKKPNEDDFFKDLREEKDKRMRAENQVKHLKEEFKKTISELQQEANTTISLLKEEFKDISEKLKKAEYEKEKLNKEYLSAEYLWPLKYETVNKELQEEKNKRIEAEQNIRHLQDTMGKLFLDTEEYLALQKTASWIRNQNEHLLCLTKKLRGEIEFKNTELGQKNQMISDNLRKIKQLTELCGKLRDCLVVTKDKAMTFENKLKINMEHCQRLTERLLQAHSQTEELIRCQEEDKNEQRTLSKLVKTAESNKCSLQIRMEEMSEVMKQQNDLISRQSDTINNKDEQLKLAYENIKLQSQRLGVLENGVSLSQENAKTKRTSFLEEEISQLMLQLEKKKESVLIKEKIMDSQARTISEQICAITNKEKEINQLKREVSETERKLAIEKTKNEELLAKIKLLQSRREQLKQRAEELEEELESLQSAQHTTKLEQIEKQIHDKQKEWEAFKSKLTEEKNDALEALKCSSNKLAERTANYQLELEDRQRKVDSLNSQIHEKDNQIQEAMSEIARLTKQLHEADERAEHMKKRFEETLKNACESWQKTMQQLQI